MTVTNLDIKFGNMVGLLVKAVIAVLPALVVLAAAAAGIYMLAELILKR